MRSGVAFGVCAAVLLAVGCGGERAGEEGTVANSPATASEEQSQSTNRAEYIAKADATCAEAASSKEGLALSRSLEGLERTPDDDPGFWRKAAAHFRKVLKFARSFSGEFKAIEPPPEDRERIEEFHKANDEAVARLQDVVDALDGREEPRDELDAYASALAKADRLAEAYGFEVCARTLPEE